MSYTRLILLKVSVKKRVNERVCMSGASHVFVYFIVSILFLLRFWYSTINQSRVL